AAPAEPPRPRIELTEEILYQILVAEFAGQLGRLDISLENYLQLARSTRDPKVVERATRIAVYARDAAAATEAARMWVELDPLNPDPHQVLAVMALREGATDEALEHLQTILDSSHGELDEKLLLIANLLGREQDKELVLGLMQRLVDTRRESPEALYAFAHVAARLGDLDRSVDLLKRTLELAPDNDNAALSYISTLQRQDRVNDALKWLEETLPTRKDNDFNLRMAYARLLTDAKRFDDARRQFEILAVQAPNNIDVQYALGLLYLQANRLDDSELYFARLVNREERDDDASYYLGRISEERKDFEKAGVWYQGVQQGENYFDAQVRQALLLAKQGRVDDARTHLRSVRTQGAQEKIILIQAEGELLTEENRLGDAMEVYNEALKAGYNADLLYARAMLAEKLDRLDIVESDLRQILEQEPDHAQALNALGYTLADRTDRFEEAYGLIQRALELNPNDFYILDSMGWILYRLGRLEEASEYLHKAMNIRQDPEIAAHLGEVLWVMGDRDAARDVWNTALQETPDDSHLLDVIKRFGQ
ncbi:MAG: tetratricopeptide repeat protein, partial [Gammaproteobacteria bacterium]